MNTAPVQLGPRELREVYAEPFAAAIRDADLASVMNSYASVDGSPCAGSSADPERPSPGRARIRQACVVADYFAVDAAHEPPPGGRHARRSRRQSAVRRDWTSSCRDETATATRFGL